MEEAPRSLPILRRGTLFTSNRYQEGELLLRVTKFVSHRIHVDTEFLILSTGLLIVMGGFRQLPILPGQKTFDLG